MGPREGPMYAALEREAAQAGLPLNEFERLAANAMRQVRREHQPNQ